MSGCGSDPSCITRRGGGGCKCGEQVKAEYDASAKQAARTPVEPPSEPAGVVERVLGHLGFGYGANEGAA